MSGVEFDRLIRPRFDGSTWPHSPNGLVAPTLMRHKAT